MSLRISNFRFPNFRSPLPPAPSPRRARGSLTADLATSRRIRNYCSEAAVRVCARRCLSSGRGERLVCGAEPLARAAASVGTPERGRGLRPSRQKSVYHQYAPRRHACKRVFGATPSNRLSALTPPRPAGRGGWGEWGPEVLKLEVGPRPPVASPHAAPFTMHLPGRQPLPARKR